MNINPLRGVLKPTRGHICLSCLLRVSNRQIPRSPYATTHFVYPSPDPAVANALYHDLIEEDILPDPGRKKVASPRKSNQQSRADVKHKGDGLRRAGKKIARKVTTPGNSASQPDTPSRHPSVRKALGKSRVEKLPKFRRTLDNKDSENGSAENLQARNLELEATIAKLQKALDKTTGPTNTTALEIKHDGKISGRNNTELARPIAGYNESITKLDSRQAKSENPMEKAPQVTREVLQTLLSDVTTQREALEAKEKIQLQVKKKILKQAKTTQPKLRISPYLSTAKLKVSSAQENALNNHHIEMQTEQFEPPLQPSESDPIVPAETSKTSKDLVRNYAAQSHDSSLKQPQEPEGMAQDHETRSYKSGPKELKMPSKPKSSKGGGLVQNHSTKGLEGGLKKLKGVKLSQIKGHSSLGKALAMQDKVVVIGDAKTKIESIAATGLEISSVAVEQPPVPELSYGLDRVLFNPGVYQLQDPRSRVFNFDPYLQTIMPVSEFDFNALKEYITSSRDQSLKQLAQSLKKRYVGSSSSMTGALAHFHFLLSQWRPINTSMLSRNFPEKGTNFTLLQRCPSAIFLRWKNGSYAIDADKQFASASILSMLGKSMEKLLTLSTEGYERYRKSSPDQVSSDERNAPESFHYSTMGDFLMRSQLDAFDARLPGSGMFDLKTRAVVSIRMEAQSPQHGMGYQIKTSQGEWESFEREYFDMIRAAFLKYSLQVRMGRMDGIFVAFHNTERIFGFQYISLPEMDSTLHGQWDTSIGDQEFKLSLDLLNKVLDKATKQYPEQSLRIHFETRETQTPFMYIFAEPVTEDQVRELQSQNDAKIEEFERNILGLNKEDSTATAAEERDNAWADIQARVQEAMTNDEMSLQINGLAEESPIAATEETESAKLYQEERDGSSLNALINSSEEDHGDDPVTEAATAEGPGDIVDDEEECEGSAQDEEDEGDRGGDQEGEVAASQGLEENMDDESQESLELASQAEDEGNRGENSNGNDGGEMVTEADGYEGKTEVEIVKEGEIYEQAETEEGKPLDIDDDSEIEHSHSAEDQHAAQASETADQASMEEASSWNDELQEAEDTTEQGEQSESQADSEFLDAIEHESSSVVPLGSSAILAMTLTVRNKVNNRYVLRPEELRPDDEWSMEYALTDVPNQDRAWGLYLACQSRRKKKLDNQGDDATEETASHYVQKLRELSRQGKAWRMEQDEIDRQKPVTVLGRSTVDKPVDAPMSEVECNGE